MAVNVNPPPQLRIPSQFLQNQETREYMRQIEVILFQLWQRTGGDDDLIDISNNQFNQVSSSQLLALQKQVDGLPNVTIDTTGFTIDTTRQTTDKTVV